MRHSELFIAYINVYSKKICLFMYIMRSISLETINLPRNMYNYSTSKYPVVRHIRLSFASRHKATLTH